MSRIERGEGAPTLHTLARIAVALSVPLASLMQRAPR
ncbi:helix-turn-helix domain-containing protein [Cupriavidus pauculus]